MLQYGRRYDFITTILLSDIDWHIISLFFKGHMCGFVTLSCTHTEDKLIDLVWTYVFKYMYKQMDNENVVSETDFVYNIYFRNHI